MNGAALGYFISGILAPLFIAAAWLIIAKLIKVKIGVAYTIAVTLCFVPALVTIDGPTIDGLVGAAIVVLVVLWQYRRAIRIAAVKAADYGASGSV